MHKGIADQDKTWTPHIWCRKCATELSQWLNGKRHSMPFAVRMVWREPSNHATGCYFCMVPPVSGGITKKKKWTIAYPNILSARRPVLHGEGISGPETPNEFTIESDDRKKKNWTEGARKAMNERNSNEAQWEDRKQWSLGVGQRRTTFWNRHTYIHNIYLHKTECGPGSSVGIATDYRLDGPGSNSGGDEIFRP